MAAARPAWEQALVTAQGVPRYGHWGFGDVVDPRQEFQGVQGMTRFMTFFRDHPQTDSAVISFSQYARVLDAEFALVIGQVAANTITPEQGLRAFLMNIFEHLRNACALDVSLSAKFDAHLDNNVFNLGRPLAGNVAMANNATRPNSNLRPAVGLLNTCT